MTNEPRLRPGIARFLAEDDGQPTVMVNLLRFVDGGEAIYRHYLEVATPIIERIGGSVVYAGTLTTPVIEVEGTMWDAVVLICWPRRVMLDELNRDEEYQEINRSARLVGLESTMLRASAPWPEVGPQRDATSLGRGFVAQSPLEDLS